MKQEKWDRPLLRLELNEAIRRIVQKTFLEAKAVEDKQPYTLPRVWTDGLDAHTNMHECMANQKPKKETINLAIGYDCPGNVYQERKLPQVNTRQGELACALDHARLLMNPDRESEIPLVQEAQRRGQNYCCICKYWYPAGKGPCQHKDLDAFMFAHEEPSRK